MSKVELDASVLASIAQTLANAAMALNAAISQTNTSPPKEPKKRGRPAKKSSPTENNGMCPKCAESYMYCACRDNPLNEKEKPKQNVELIKVENVDEIISEDNQKGRTAGKANYLFSLKGKGNRSVASRKEVVTDNRGKQKFLDVDSVAHEKITWEPTERARPPAQLQNFICSKCSRKFQAYASEYPQAFFGTGGTGEDFDESYSIMCNRCGVK